jgi:ribosomal protein L21
MATFNPDIRANADWDGDGFICYDTVLTDQLNRMHTGLSSDANLVNLHWAYVRTGEEGSAEFTPYGLRLLHCVTGTLTGAGAYFGRAGGTRDFTVVNGQTYTVSVWVRVEVFANVPFIFNVDDGATGVDVGFTPTTTWQRVNATITAGSTTLGFRIYKNGSATDVTFDATGFMIVEGSIAPVGFNVGDASNRYDNVTDYLESANWSFGRKNWTATMFDEGTASLTLRNDSRVFMPENTLSPLYGKMLQRLLVTIDSRSPGHTTWTRMFTGWTDDYDPILSRTTGQLQTMVSCTQGRWQLDQIQYNKSVSGTQTADEVIRSVILSGFTSAATPYQVILNTAKLSACYFVDPDDILDLDTGVSTIPTAGDGWGGDVNATRVITDVMNIERGFVFIDRSGVVKFYNRHHYHDPALTPATTAINLDTDATERSYVYGDGYQNVVRVTYRPKGTSAGVIWTSKEPIEVEPGDTKEVNVKLEYEEGAKVTVDEVTAFGDADPSSTYTTTPAYAKAKTNITYALENGRVKLTIFNYSRQRLTFDIVLRGGVIESYGGQTVERSGDVRGGKIVISVDSKQLTEENEAKNLGDYLLGIHDRTAGEFRSFTIKSKNATWFADIINVSIGSKVSLSETQTGHAQTYYVISEDANWMPGVGIDIRYSLYPLFRLQAPWILGTSVLGTDTYLGY